MKSIKSTWRNPLAGATVLALLAVSVPAQAAETVKIFRSTMPDGSIVLGDKPSSGASSVASDTIVLTAPRGAADAERDYWRRQSEGFNLRQQQRDSVQRSRRAMSPDYSADMAMYGDDMQPRVSYYGHSVGKPLVPPHLVPRDYATSPGAARGRSSGFIGSGFSTSR